MLLSIGERIFTIDLQHRCRRPIAKPSSRRMDAELKWRFLAKAKVTSAKEWCQIPRFEAVWAGLAPGRVFVTGKTRRPFIWDGTLFPSGLFAAVLSTDQPRLLWASHHAVSERIQKFRVVAADATSLLFSYWSQGRLLTVHERWHCLENPKEATVSGCFPGVSAPTIVADCRPKQGQDNGDIIDWGSGSPSKPGGTNGGSAA